MARTDKKSPTERKPRGLRWPARFLTTTLRPALRSLGHLRLFRVEVSGREFIPLEGAAILVLNHPTQKDPFVIWAIIKRLLVFMAKQSLWRIPGFGLLMHFMGHIAVDRGNSTSAERAMRQAVSILKHGGMVINFFDGGCSDRVKPLERLKTGCVRQAITTGAVIVPGGIVYGRRSATVRFGEPIDPADFSGDNAIYEMLAAVRARVVVLCDQA